MPMLGKKKGHTTCRTCSKMYCLKNGEHKHLCPDCISEKSQCVFCGNEMPKFSRKNGKLRQFCSQSCCSLALNLASRTKRPKKERRPTQHRRKYNECVVCGAEHDRLDPNNRLCPKCYSETAICEQCGIEFRKREMTKGRPRRFCGYECQAKNTTSRPEVKQKMSDAMKRLWETNGEFVGKVIEAVSSPELRKKSSDRFKARWQDEEYRKKMSEVSRGNWENPQYREIMGEAVLKGLLHKGKTDIELAVEKKLISMGIEAIYNYRAGNKFIDFAILDRMIGIECDGEYWHRGREREDAERDEYLSQMGWTIIHLKEEEIKHDLNDALSRKLFSLLTGN